jgi:hypothetical protein
VGPSLPPAERPQGPFDWRPPAAAGDILGLLDRPPSKLCLIDGYFDSRPAPWHKELLAVMATGTVLFGAASMGALRAAELHSLGMIGVGSIYAAYREERLRGDDEVALIHADERLRWAALTVPMVEVRATLLAACRARIISPPLARKIRAIVHDVHFQDRDWPLMELLCVRGAPMDPDAFQRVQAMHVQLKRSDALLCLETAMMGQGPRPATPEPPQTCFIQALARAL